MTVFFDGHSSDPVLFSYFNLSAVLLSLFRQALILEHIDIDVTEAVTNLYYPGI